MTIYSGREFSLDEIEQIRPTDAAIPDAAAHAAVAQAVRAVRLGPKPNGELKDMSCRVALLRMQADGLITLPASRMPHRGRPHFPATAATDAQAPLLRPVHELATLTLQPVLGTPASRLWNEYVQRYHYLGYTPMSGSQMRYNVFAGEQLVALLSFGASAWKLGPREQFIGWPEPMRLKNLQRVVNNARFLILPWIQSKGLASKILSKVARQLPKDWQLRYGYRPVLFETFVEAQRHRGTCYKAANWVHIGQTTGRGKKSAVHHQIIPIKDIWLYPLQTDFAAVLCR